jgi:hypothetical protein
MDLHAALTPLAWLIGTWRGEGRGEYPTIEPFGYREELVVGHLGKPFLTWSHRTRHAETGAPLHAESGFLRAVGEGRVELVLAHPFGAAEVLLGEVEGTALRLACEHVVITPTAVRVDATTREVRVEGDVLSYDLAMAAVGEPLTHHLSATLRRAAEPG